MTNHPAPPEGTGPECDKFSTEALDAHWAGYVQKMLDNVGPLAGKTLADVLIDSYETGGQNWTPKMKEEFQQRRGYDLTKFLPTFSGHVMDNPEVSDRFLWDLRRTIADLFRGKVLRALRGAVPCARIEGVDRAVHRAFRIASVGQAGGHRHGRILDRRRQGRICQARGLRRAHLRQDLGGS